MSKDYFIALVCLLAGAAGVVACVPATHEAGIRRMAESRMRFCQFGDRTWQKPCIAEVQSYCRAMALEKTCGEGFQ